MFRNEGEHSGEYRVRDHLSFNQSNCNLCFFYLKFLRKISLEETIYLPKNILPFIHDLRTLSLIFSKLMLYCFSPMKGSNTSSCREGYMNAYLTLLQMKPRLNVEEFGTPHWDTSILASGCLSIANIIPFHISYILIQPVVSRSHAHLLRQNGN